MSRIALIAFMFLGFSVFSCKNKAVAEDVKGYCACLTEHKSNPEGRESCLEMMDEIKAKYAGDNRALLQILDETENCL